MMFYLKNDNDKTFASKIHHGYNEIDCAFILKEKDKVVLERDKITCFKGFDSKEESGFYNIDNFEDNITLKKNDIVILEIKSKWFDLKRKKKNNKNNSDDNNDNNNNDNNNNKDNYNLLEKFINKAKRFIEYYEDLNLIKKDQNKILIYLYNYSMWYDIENENDEIKKAYKMIENDDKIQLYIAYFQPYLKLMNSYERVITINTLKKKVKEFDQNLKILKEEKEKQRENSNQLEKKVIELQQQKDELDKKVKAIQQDNERRLDEKVKELKQEKDLELEKKVIELKQEQQKKLEIQQNTFDEKFKNQELKFMKIQDDNKKEIAKLLKMIEKMSNSQKMNSEEVYSERKNEREDVSEEICDQKNKFKDENAKGNDRKNKKNSLTSSEGANASTIDSFKKN